MIRKIHVCFVRHAETEANAAGIRQVRNLSGLLEYYVLT